MPYALHEVELSQPLLMIQLAPSDSGIGIVSRQYGRVVGFALHKLAPGSRLDPADVGLLLDPAPVAPPVLPAHVTGPTITAAICTRDRPELLAECLASLRQQSDPPDEVLVIDNAPADDRSRVVATQLGARYAKEPCPGLDFARNRAIRLAKNEVVAFIDDDVVVDVHWLDSQRRVWGHHPDAGAVTGQILPRELDTDAQVAFERRGGFRGGNELVRYVGAHLDRNPIYPYAPGIFGAGANLSVRRSIALRLGGFDEALDTGPPLPGGGDLDIMHRVVRHGHALVYEPRAVVFHRHRRDERGLLRQYDSWGRSLMAWATKSYRSDPTGRPKVRKLVKWFFTTQAREALSANPAESEDRRAALAELRGGVFGILGTYRRSQIRSARRRREEGDPTVAILPWGDIMEDYTEPIGLTVDDYADCLTGGWLFGFTQALQRVGVAVVIICWSRSVSRPTRRIHHPTGATLWFLPPSPLYEICRQQIEDPYDWRLRKTGRGRVAALRAVGARLVLPYLTATPVSLAKVLWHEGCRAVLCQEYEEGRFDLCVVLGRVFRLPVFATFQGGDHTRTPFERAVRPHSMRASAGMIIGAEREAVRVGERYAVPPNRIARIPNPFDPATLPLVSREVARLALGIYLDTRVVVWHGRVDIHPKGLDILIEAWLEVRSTCTEPPMLLLLGTGSGSAWLRSKIEELGLNDIRWRDEFVVDRAVIASYLSASNVFVLPSRQEGFPVAPMEAMAAALPVIAADAPGVRAVVGTGEGSGGVVVPRGDTRALSAELRRLIEDRRLAAELGQQGRRRVDELFSLEAIGMRLRGLLLQE